MSEKPEGRPQILHDFFEGLFLLREPRVVVLSAEDYEALVATMPAMAFALSHDIRAVAIAAHAGDRATYPDCREEFFSSFQFMARGAYGPFLILRPYVDTSKADIVKIGEHLGVPFWKTWSCYRGDAVPCGTCGACDERAKALGTHENQGMTFAKLRPLTRQDPEDFSP